MLDRDAIRRLTEAYPQLRGYQQLPFALGLLLLQVGTATGWRRPGDHWVFLGIVGAQIVLWRWIGSYYDRRFGVVQVRKTEGAGCTVAAAVALFFVLQMLSNIPGSELPVQLGFLGAGLALAASAVKNIRLYWQRLLPAAFFVGAALIPGPVYGQGETTMLYHAIAIGFAIVWTITAIADHHSLVRGIANVHA